MTEEAEDTIRAVYRAAGFKPPRAFIWTPSLRAMVTHPLPIDAGRCINRQVLPAWDETWHRHAGPDERRLLWDMFTQNTGALHLQALAQEPEDMRRRIGGHFYEVCVYRARMQLYETYELFLDEMLLSRDRELLQMTRKLAEHVDFMTPYLHACLVSRPALKRHTDARGRLHCMGGPAAVYEDGWKIYAIDGVLVPPQFIEHPERISIRQIDAERNITLRRVMVKLYKGDYYRDCGAKMISEDKFGRLYRKERGFQQPLVFVRVKNSTREPDGTYREYVLRVPPAITTPLQAVAWSFRMSPKEYLRTQKMT